MNSWGNIYYLKSDVTEKDIWIIIQKMFPKYNLPNIIPKHFNYETDSENILLASSAKERYVDFLFTKTLEETRLTLRIVFDREFQKIDNGDVHALFYKEIAENCELSYCFDFFPLLKSLIPKKFISNRITNNLEKCKQIFFKYDDIIEQNTKLIDKEFSENISTDKVFVKFCADEDGKFLFPEAWIEKLSNELWFTDAKFEKAYTLLSVFTRENFLRKNAKLRKAEKVSRNNEFLKSKLSKEINIDEWINQKKDLIKIIFRTDARIMVNSGILNNIEIKPNENAVFDDAGYKDLRNHIINSIDYRNELERKTFETMSELSENDMKNDIVLKENISFHLKELGLDENNLQNMVEELNQCKENIEFLEKENNALKSKKHDLENEIYKLQSANISSQEIIENKESSDELIAMRQKLSVMSQKNEENEKEIKSLKVKCDNLKNRNTYLEKKNNSTNVKDDCYILEIPCKEKELFSDEIEDFLYNCLYSKLEEEKKNLPQNKETEVTRKRDVIESLINNKYFSFEKSETKQKIARIESILKASNRPNLDELVHEGFVKIENTKNHPKVYFYNERYQLTFSLSPSDEKVSMNKMKEIQGRCLLA